MSKVSFVSHENEPKTAYNGQNQAFLSGFEGKTQKIGVQNQKSLDFSQRQMLLLSKTQKYVLQQFGITYRERGLYNAR